MKIARRTILKAGSGFIAFVALGHTAYALPAPKNSEEMLLRLIANRAAATRLGRHYLRQHPELADSVELTRRLTERLGASGGIRRAALRRTLAADFAAGRTRTLDGWILAQTEAELCVLAALKTSNNRSRTSLV